MPKRCARSGHVDRRDPAALVIVVARDDEGVDARFGESREAVSKVDLALERPVGALECVAGHEQELDALLEREVHDAPPRDQRGVAEGGGDACRNLGGQAHEGAVEMQVTRVQEPEHSAIPPARTVRGSITASAIDS